MEIHVPGGGGFLDALLNTNEAYEGPSDNVIPNANEDKLLDALAAMERGDSEYVILQDDRRFLQAAGDAKSQYTLEYNDGSDKVQYRATNTRLSGTEITDAFVSYLNRDPSWKTKFSWTEFRL
jgi:hypothetical protein